MSISSQCIKIVIYYVGTDYLVLHHYEYIDLFAFNSGIAI